VTDALGNVTTDSIEYAAPALVDQNVERPIVFDGYAPDVQTIRVPVNWMGDVFSIHIVGNQNCNLVCAEQGSDDDGNIWIDITIDGTDNPFFVFAGLTGVTASYDIEDDRENAQLPIPVLVKNTKPTLDFTAPSVVLK
jgi:hypothetical protein